MLCTSYHILFTGAIESALKINILSCPQASMDNPVYKLVNKAVNKFSINKCSTKKQLSLEYSTA